MHFDIFTLGIGKVIASGYAMKQIPFLQSARLKPMMYIKINGVQKHRITHINFERVESTYVGVSQYFAD